MKKINTTKSQQLFQQALRTFPGGVNSPVRSFKGLDQTPLFIERAQGAYLYDADENQLMDFCMSFGPMILGHQNEKVKNDLHLAIERGLSFGATERYSLELADFILQKINFIDELRFVSSGTEAVMTAIRLSRGVTGRNKILKFIGCYHGHADSLLIKAGSGVLGISEATSRGVPKSVVQDTLTLELGDEIGVEKVFSEWGHDIAAIIVEPLPANNGLLIQNLSFLKKLREVSTKYNALLIFDEVISGFRIGFGGMSKETNITPDIVTYGKIIGGGMPVGALGAKKEIMEQLAPLGPVYQAGTLSANPISMVAGLSTLKQLDEKFYQNLNTTSDQVAHLISKFLSKNKKYQALNCVQYQSLFWIKGEQSLFNQLFIEFLDRGVYLAPNAFEVGFVSIAHQNEISKLKEMLEV